MLKQTEHLQNNSGIFTRKYDVFLFLRHSDLPFLYSTFGHLLTPVVIMKENKVTLAKIDKLLPVGVKYVS